MTTSNPGNPALSPTAINAEMEVDDDKKAAEKSVGDSKLNDSRRSSMLMRRSTFFTVDNPDVKAALEADC